MLYLWNMKGHLLTSTDASCGPQPDILCVLFTRRHEWDPKNVIATGCADGVIRVKSILRVHEDYRTVSAWDESLEVLVNQQHLGCESIHACGSFPQCKLASTRVWAPISHTPQMGIIALLLPRVLRRRCIRECVCHYLELCLIWPLVTCLSRRYGRRSTPEHNYLALQKSPCPRGRMEQRGTVMSRGDAAATLARTQAPSPDESLRPFCRLFSPSENSPPV